jgi:hypothetical protein
MHVATKAATALLCCLAAVSLAAGCGASTRVEAGGEGAASTPDTKTPEEIVAGRIPSGWYFEPDPRNQNPDWRTFRAGPRKGEYSKQIELSAAPEDGVATKYPVVSGWMVAESPYTKEPGEMTPEERVRDCVEGFYDLAIDGVEPSAYLSDELAKYASGIVEGYDGWKNDLARQNPTITSVKPRQDGMYVVKVREGGESGYTATFVVDDKGADGAVIVDIPGRFF